MVAQKQPEEMEEVAKAVVHRCRSDEQNPRPDHEPRKCPVARRRGIAEAVGFVDYKQSDNRSVGQSDRGSAERLVCDDRRLDVVLREQRPPLVYEYRGNDECERLAPGECDRESHIGLAKSHGVGEQGPAVAVQDSAEPPRGWHLVRGQPLGKREPALLRTDESARGECHDRHRRRLRAWL